jgi:hypothetical protein
MMEETLKFFETTRMYSILKEICELLELNYDLNDFKQSSPFWPSDETSYACFLSVLENEYDVFMSQKMTRSKTSLTRFVVDEIMNMLVKYVPDDKIEASIDTRCVICLFNKAKIEFKCGHTLVCQKCFNLLVIRSIKTCPLCRHVLN